MVFGRKRSKKISERFRATTIATGVGGLTGGPAGAVVMGGTIFALSGGKKEEPEFEKKIREGIKSTKLGREFLAFPKKKR